MRQSTRYRFLTIAGKLRCELRIVVDDKMNPEYTASNSESKTTIITFYPMITLSILRPAELDENGQRIMGQWNPNDSLSLTKYTLPLFVDELKSFVKDMKIPELYTYHGKRLELNESVADKVRRPFMIGNTTVELSATIITNENDERIEGMKMKFNNEQSSVILTINDMISLRDNLCRLDVDSVAMLLYLNYVTRPDKPKTFDTLMNVPKVDIAPKNSVDFME